MNANHSTKTRQTLDANQLARIVGGRPASGFSWNPKPVEQVFPWTPTWL